MMESPLKKLIHVVAAERNGGIAYKQKMPWPKLTTDRKVMFELITKTEDPNKMNAAVLGRLTWISVKRPIPKCFNVVLSSHPSSEFPGAQLVCSSLESLIDKIHTPPLSDQIENIIILGGTQVYKEALASPLTDKVYYTDVMAEFPSDTFWPGLDDTFKLIEDDDRVPKEIIKENGVEYRFLVYQKIKPQE